MALRAYTSQEFIASNVLPLVEAGQHYPQELQENLVLAGVISGLVAGMGQFYYLCTEDSNFSEELQEFLQDKSTAPVVQLPPGVGPQSQDIYVGNYGVLDIDVPSALPPGKYRVSEVWVSSEGGAITEVFLAPVV